MNLRFTLAPLLAVALGWISPSFADSRDGRLDIYWIDVEGGAATLIVTPADESILIDAGFPGGRDSDRILEAAKRAGLSRIDHLLITHFHFDHFGGAAEIAPEFPIAVLHERAIPDRDDKLSGPAYPMLIKQYREMSVGERRRIEVGATIPLRALPEGAPRLSLRCIAADRRIIPPPTPLPERNPLTGSVAPKPHDPSDNGNSAVFILEFGEFRLFVGGDVTWNVEADIVTPYNVAGTVDVYLVNHHGRNTSNNPMLIRSLAPTVAVMSNGPRKGGDADVLATLKNTPSIQAVYQMHRDVRGDDRNTADEYIANVEERCAGNAIRLAVARDASDYTVEIPARGHSRTFAVRARNASSGAPRR